jgi:hypothetical protein
MEKSYRLLFVQILFFKRLIVLEKHADNNIFLEYDILTNVCPQNGLDLCQPIDS